MLQKTMEEKEKSYYKGKGNMQNQYDVIVAGGGPSGVAAAIAAARNGCNTLIIEREAFFGGMATLACVPAFGPYTNGVQDLIGGIGREILEELKKGGYESPFYDRKSDRIEGIDWYPIDPEHLKRVLDYLVIKSGSKVLFHTAVTDVKTHNGTIEAVQIFGKAGFQWLEAKYFIDCTGDGDLAAMAGAPWEYGDAQGRVQAGTLCFRAAGIDVEQFMDYVRREGEDGNLSVASEKAKKDGHFPAGETKIGGMALQENGIAGLNFGHVYNLKPLDPWDLSRAEMEARKRLPEMIGFLREYVPGMGHCVLVSSGPYLGIRESRRIKGRYTLTKEDFKNRADFPDAIAYYSYPIDIHGAVPEENQGNEKMYHNSKYKNGECYGVPYRCLIPVGMKNLAVAGRSISSDRTMMGSVRIMCACFATGQAAGTAAAIGMREGGSLELGDVDTGLLRRRLEEQKVYIKNDITLRY